MPLRKGLKLYRIHLDLADPPRLDRTPSHWWMQGHASNAFSLLLSDDRYKTRPSKLDPSAPGAPPSVGRLPEPVPAKAPLLRDRDNPSLPAVPRSKDNAFGPPPPSQHTVKPQISRPSRAPHRADKVKPVANIPLGPTLPPAPPSLFLNPPTGPVAGQ